MGIGNGKLDNFVEILLEIEYELQICGFTASNSSSTSHISLIYTLAAFMFNNAMSP